MHWTAPLLIDFSSALAIIFGLPIAGVVGIPLALIYSHHRRKMEELRHKEQRLIAEDIRAEFESLRTEIQNLRDITMQYDLSFDTALHQVERRLNHLERPQYSQSTGETSEKNVTLGGRG